MFDLFLKGLMVGIGFLSMIKRCQMKYRWGRLLISVRLGRLLVSSNVEDVCCRGGLKRFSRICSEVGVDPK